jgi:NADPH:quinone reductase
MRPDEERVRSYGAAETVDHNTVPLAEAVRRAHPDGIDVLINLASAAESFASLAPLVRFASWHGRAARAAERR